MFYYCFCSRIITPTKSYKDSQHIKLKKPTYIYEVDVEIPCAQCSPSNLPIIYLWGVAVRNTIRKPRIHTTPIIFTPQIQCTLSSCHLPKCAYRMQGIIFFTISRIYAEYSKRSLLEVLYIFDFQYQTLLQNSRT